MISHFEQLENAIIELEALIDEIKKDNDRLKKETQELKGVIEDRDLEILQLQEDIQKRSSEFDTEKNEIEHKLDGLLGRVSSITVGKARDN